MRNVPSCRPAQVVFLANGIFTPNGVVSSVDSLAGEFQSRGVDVKIIHTGMADAEFRRRYETVCLRPAIRLTKDVRDFAATRRSLKLIRRILSIPIFAWERRRTQKVVASIQEDALVIAAGLECLEFISAITGVPGWIVAQVHLAPESLTADQRARVERCRNLSHRLSVLDSAYVAALQGRGSSLPLAIPNACPLQRDSSLSRKEKRVVFVGRLAPEKQVHQLLEAFERVAPPDWELVVTGAGPEEARLRYAAAALAARIEIASQTSDVSTLFRRASINVLPSRAEGLPMSIIEAAARGVPTIAYDSGGGVRTALGQHGILVPQGDVDRLAEELSALMRDGAELERRQRLSLADERFAPSVVCDLWVEEWQQRGVRERSGVTRGRVDS